MATKIVVIEDQIIASMAKDPRFKSFPGLQQVGKALGPRRGCGRCGHKNNNRAQAFQAAKRQIANLPQERLDELKQLLKADELAFYVRDPKTKKMNIKRV